MSIDFTQTACQDASSKQLFGLSDDEPGKRARIDENDGTKWIAVVNNSNRYNVIFTAIDHCIDINRKDGKMAKRCDGFLSYKSTIIFVELKERSTKGSGWVKEGEEQLRISIGFFEDTRQAEFFKQKKAYIANSERPKFKESQMERMDSFLEDTGYILRIENRIELL